MEFIKGKCYRITNPTFEVEWYFCYEDLINSVLYTSGYIVNNIQYKEIETIHVFHTDIYEEVDLSVFITYLPIGHPERIIYRKKLIKNLLTCLS